jgi:hypothetical protein
MYGVKNIEHCAATESRSVVGLYPCREFSLICFPSIPGVSSWRVAEGVGEFPQAGNRQQAGIGFHRPKDYLRFFNHFAFNTSDEASTYIVALTTSAVCR